MRTMRTTHIRHSSSTGGGVFQAMAIALTVIVIIALAAYYVLGVGAQNYSPGTPYQTSAPATGAPATAPALPTVHYS